MLEILIQVLRRRNNDLDSNKLLISPSTQLKKNNFKKR